VRRWPKVLLIVSLVLNIFLIALIGGSIWRWTHNPTIGLDNSWRKRVAEALPEPQASAFRHTMHATFNANLDLVRRSHAARTEAARLFVQPQFDSEAVLFRLNQARLADTALRWKFEQSITRFSATLPQDQRVKLAEVLKAGPFRQRHPHPSDRQN
jgi:uncharacterized membrane protein